MEFIIDALVFVVRLALAGFVMWGGWLSLRSYTAAAPAAQAEKDDGFERVASLVLLALLCTTIAGVA